MRALSPEQLRSSKNVDARADLWSLGVMMYELLTKELPFDGESPSEIFAAILEKTPTPLASLRRDIPDALSAIIMRTLSKDPDERFEDAGELARALAPLGSGKWTHLVEGANRSVARIRKSPPASSALVTAAIAAAHTARPPAPISGPETPLAFDIARPTLDEVIDAPTASSTPPVAATRIVRARCRSADRLRGDARTNARTKTDDWCDRRRSMDRVDVERTRARADREARRGLQRARKNCRRLRPLILRRPW